MSPARSSPSWRSSASCGTSCASRPSASRPSSRSPARGHSRTPESGTLPRIGSQVATRIRAAVHRHGLRGFLEGTVRRVTDRVWLHEEHYWSALDTASVTDAPDFESPLTLTLATADDLPLVEQVGHSVFDARKWHGEGHDLWLVRDGDAMAFMCWIFNGSAPVAAARGGWLQLPAGVACLEDSITNPDYRGRGIAPRTWKQIAVKLRERGIDSMVTKVETENVPSRKAVAKAGFED